MIDELNRLNEQFYRLYGRLHENEMLMSKEQVDEIRRILLDNYRREYDLIFLKNDIEYKNKKFDLKQRSSVFISRIWRHFIFWRRCNIPAEIAIREIDLAADELFGRKIAELEKLEAAKANSAVATPPTTDKKTTKDKATTAAITPPTTNGR